jgi:hypothetical protein
LDLKHIDQVRGSNIVNVGMDLTEFYLSVEWDILEVPATRNEEYYLPQESQSKHTTLVSQLLMVHSHWPFLTVSQ